MKQLFYDALKRAAAARGVVIYRPQPNTVGESHLKDIARLLAGVSQPVILDIGANEGQSIRDYQQTFPESLIHAFEPSPRTFAKLSQAAGVVLNNVGVGSVPGSLPLLEHEQSDMTSFLPPGAECWDSVDRTVQVPVTTVDRYCSEHGITHVHLLKTDTQGFDYEVLQGADGLFQRSAVDLVMTEVTFADLYDGIPPLDVLYRFLADRQFRLVGIYHVFRYPDQSPIEWCDALFVRTSSRQVGSDLADRGSLRSRR